MSGRGRQQPDRDGRTGPGDQRQRRGKRYRRDELARAAGVKERNLRYYQERGLLPPPEREGRIAWYSDEHLARLRLIDDLLGRGYSVNGIGELLRAWEQGSGIAGLLGLERVMSHGWVNDEPVSLPLSALAELFGTAGTAADTRRAVELGYLRMDGETVTHVSRRLLDATSAVVREGVPVSEILDVAAFVRSQADAVAGRFVDLFRRHVIAGRELDELTPDDVQRVIDAVTALRPVAGDVVAAEFSRAMAERMDAEMAGWLRGAQGAAGARGAAEDQGAEAAGAEAAGRTAGAGGVEGAPGAEEPPVE
ncbi:MerR family transcriptional regulator [Streptomyces sp. DH12]|uniref:MerR family transcriptional regulator n=1 Tax=Streptomyces sp. DH12 TaxID=2857010 RepID=UPI001E549139|nr:MerR family transcriptional regulator [Streptomyces sp. DH12]